MFLVNNQDQAVFYVMYSKFDNGVAIGNVRSNGTVKATEVYAYLVDKFGTLYSDDSQTPQGSKIWTSLAKFYPNIDVKDTGGRFVATKKTQVDEGVNDPHIFKAVFMAGGPGSGKSFVAKNILSGTGLRSIDSDEVYEYLMKKQGLSLDPETIFSPQGQEIRDKAKGLSRRREATYLDGRIGLIIDGTGKDVSKYQVMAQKLRAIGYDLSMIYVNTSLEVAQQRNKQRERSLEPAKVEQMWNEVQQNLMKFQQIFGAGRFHIIDNSGGLEDLDRQKNFDKVYNETQRFLNTPPSKRAALAWIQNQKAQNDEKRSANTPTTNYKSDGGTTATD
jgi:dephospho-CoA kinase